MFLQRVTNPLYVCTATILCPEALYTVLENGKHFARDGTYQPACGMKRKKVKTVIILFKVA